MTHAVRPLIWLTAPLLLAAGAGAGCHRAVADHDESSAGPKRVRCAAAEARDVQDTVELHGTVAPLPDRDAQIAAQVPGRIVAVLVREGDRVQKGQPLARIDDAALADQAKQAAAQLAKARAESNLASVSRARVQRVFERGIAARQELDDAETRFATAQASEAEAKAASEIAARQLERASVRSPLAGVVLKLLRKPGELVDGTPATPIVEVGDPAVLELVASAPAADLVRSERGAAASIELPALPSVRLTGRVVAVSPAVDRTTGLGVVRVSLALGPGPAPPVGVTGTARVAVGASRLAVLVPSAALRAATGDEAEVVLCGDDGRAHVARVRRGITVDRLVEVLPAAPEGSDGGGAPFPLQARTAVAVEPVLGIADGDSLERAR
jgi:RND family efflux transporter MFP subunit